MFTLNGSLLALVMALVGCRSSMPLPVHARGTTPAARPASKLEAFATDANYSEDFDYFESVKPAIARAKEEGRTVALYFNTCYSGSCDEFRANVLADPAVSAWIDEHLVFVNADMDRYPGLERKYLPKRSNRILILNTEGDALVWIPPTARDPTPGTPDAFLTELRAALASR